MLKTTPLEEQVELLQEANRQLRELVASLERVMPAVVELLAVSSVRGDDDIPHPSDDHRLWSARCQDAWIAAREAVNSASPGAIDTEIEAMQKWEMKTGIGLRRR